MVDIELINKQCKGTLVSHLDIKITHAESSKLVGEMVVGEQHHQPHGIMHGGASGVLAETLASIGAGLNCPSDKYPVGTHLSIHHLKSFKTGILIGTATPIHLGKTSHLWQIEIQNSGKEKISHGELAVRILDKTI